MIFINKTTKNQKIIHGVASVLIVLVSLSFFLFIKDLDWQYLITLKYFGFILVCLLGSAIVFLPFPLTLFIGASALFLNPILVGLIGGFVVSVGSMIPYFVGAEGKIVFEDIKGYKRIHNWATRNTHGFWSIFVIAMLPFPLFDLVCVSAGILGVKLKKYFFAVLFGKTIAYLITALLFYYLGTQFPEFWEAIKAYLQK